MASEMASTRKSPNGTRRFQPLIEARPSAEPNRRLLQYRAKLPLPDGQSLPVVYLLDPGKIRPYAPVAFLVNGFGADAKTWTFRPLREKGAFAHSVAEYLASQGIVVVVKDLRSERVRLERSYEEHVARASQYAAAVTSSAPTVVEEIAGVNLDCRGVHWVGHSLGGMVQMACKDRSKVLSLTTIGSPTYMYLDDPRLLFSIRLFTPLFPVRQINEKFAIPFSLFESLINTTFARLGIESHKKLTHDQHLLIGLLLHLPVVRMISHIVLNLDHIDFETAAAFVRCGLADENFHLLIEFARALKVNGSVKDRVLGKKIVPLRIPTLVIGGEGDDIAPVHSVLNLLQFVRHPIKEQVIFEFYDHLGILLKYGARFDVWPILSTFIWEMSLGRKASAEHINVAESIARHNALTGDHGKKCRTFCARALERIMKRRGRLRRAAKSS